MRRVVAYGDMESLISSNTYRDIKSCIHLAESANMKGMLENNRAFDSVHLFREISNVLDPDWSKEKQRMRCLTIISVCIRS